MKTTDSNAAFCLALLSGILSIQFAFGVSLCDDSNKIEVEEFEFDSETDQFLWIPSDYKVVFAHTKKYGLYRSEDEGRTWKSQLPLMVNSTVIMPPLSRKGVSSLKSTKDPNKFYLVGWGGLFWVTESKGSSYQAKMSPFYLETLEVHPSNPAWLLGGGRTPKCFDSKATGTCNEQLWVSKDSGTTWTQVSSYVYQFSWGNAGLHDVNVDNIWVLEWDSKTGDYGSKSVNDLALKHSVDYLKTTISHELTNVIFILSHNENMYIAQQEKPGATLRLFVSEDDGKSFNLAKFPFDFKEQQYTILDDTEGQVFMSVSHGSLYWHNIYSSDSLGSEYDLSLEYCRRDKGHTEFKRLWGLDGIYLANQLEGVQDLNGGAGAKTVITFNKGGKWQPLGIPNDIHGEPIACTAERCQLNLHGANKASSGASNPDFFGPLHSSPSAVGLILATGNVGTYLSNTLTNVQTYLSRDAGWTWELIRDGNFIYEFADHGALIVMTAYEGKTSSILYTWDQGLTFTECLFTSGTSVDITSIVVKPGGTTQSFILHGTRTVNGEVRGVIVHLDFSNLHERACTDDDYEWWSPYDRIDEDSKCLLGQTVSFKRRKREAQCYNGNEFELEKVTSSCPCTQEDYECDFCYEPGDGACTKIDNCDRGDIQPPCVGTYNTTKGFRLIPGTKCDPTKGLDLRPEVHSCDSASGSGKKENKGGISGGAIAGILFTVVLVGAATGGLGFYIRTHGIQSLQDRFKGAFGKLQGYSNNFGRSTVLDEELLTSKDAEVLDEHEIGNR